MSTNCSEGTTTPAPSDNGAPQIPISGPKATPADIFTDLSGLRLSQDFAASCGVGKAMLTIPIRKPFKEWFIRTNPDLRFETCVIEMKDDREIYIVDRALWDELAHESTFGPRVLTGAMTRQNMFFLWPMRLPGPDGKIDNWGRSALEAATLAATRWLRVAPNMHLAAYEVTIASADWPEPEWPRQTLNELLRTAFKGRVIDNLDHPTLQRLRGEV